MNKRRGFTLVEVLIAIGILAILLVVVSNLLRVPTKANQMSEKEFQVQSALRVASESVNNSVRNASAVFLLTKATPIDANEDLSEKWDYLICEERDGVSEVVHYRWMKSGSGFKHVRNVIAEAKSEKVHFFIDFETSDNGKLLQYKIMAQDIETGQKKEVSSEIKPLNSFNIVDNAKKDPLTGKKIGNALAFRNDVPDPSMGGQQGYDVIMVSLVLDVSGSMLKNLNGNWYTAPAKMRKTILIKEAKKLVDRLLSSPNKERIMVNIYPFSPRAFYRYSSEKRDKCRFIKLQDNGISQESLIKSVIDDLDPRLGDGTNIGDGIRWAYYDILEKEKENKTKRTKNFLLVLSDGYPTDFTMKNDVSYYGSGDDPSLRYNSIESEAMVYTKKMAEYVKKFPKQIDGSSFPDISPEAEKIDVTVIGFSNVPEETSKSTEIGMAIGAEPGTNGQYFIKAGSEAALDAAFSQFTDKVLDKASLWYVVSPK